MTSWIDDLFGGRDKEYPNKYNTGYDRISQTSDDVLKNESRKDDYPHYTCQGENNDWHRSEDGKTHSSTWNLFGSNEDDDSVDDSGSSDEGNSWSLFS